MPTSGHPALDAIRADERNFIDVDTMVSIIAEPATVIDGDAVGAKLVVLVKRNPAVEPERFHPCVARRGRWCDWLP